MSVPLTTDERRQYTAIIDGILATANLETISRKKIRQGLETSLGGKDLSEQKDAIKKLIEARFDAVSGADADVNADEITVVAPPPGSSSRKRSSAVAAATTNGSSHHGRHIQDSDASAGSEPAKKKVKRSSSVEDADAKLAAQLQAQENRMARGPTTRGGGDKPRPDKKKNKKKAVKKKSEKRVGDDLDSDVDASDSAPPKRKAGGGFQKPFNLSDSLSALCGETQLSRPQVVKKIWEHIKANELQDPSDKRQIVCDDRMFAVFKQNRVDMFKMNKEIGHHLYPVGEE